MTCSALDSNSSSRRVVLLLLTSTCCHFHGSSAFLPSTSTPFSFASSSSSLNDARRSRHHVIHMAESSSISEEVEVEEDEQLPPLNPGWIVAAQKPFPWEDPATVGQDEDWQNGQRWYVTRQALVDLMVLPQDMSNGSWEHYADAAMKGEEKVLQKVPQLLRLKVDDIRQSAQTILNELSLPPVLLRKEPILVAMEPKRLKGGFNSIIRDVVAAEEGEDGSTPAATPLDRAKEACRDTPGLLVEAASKWIPSSLDDDEDATRSLLETSGTTSDQTIQFVQKSFDNEVSASDLHMQAFLPTTDADDDEP